MKNLTLLAAMAVCGVGLANAQYSVDPTLVKQKDAKYDVVLLDEASISTLKAEGATVQDIRADDTNVFLYVWENTFTGGDGSYPGVDAQMDGYTSLTVTSVGWSGAGFNLANKAGDFSHFTDDTHFHFAIRTETSLTGAAIIVGDVFEQNNTDSKWTPAKVSVGESAFVDNGKTYPLIGALDAEGDWAGFDITFRQLKKLYPEFSYTPQSVKGNVVSFLAGGVSGQNICLDAMYFYTPNDGAVEGITADADIVVTNKTINASGANEIALYNLAGQLVKKANSSAMGIENVAKGVYVVKAGNAVKKVVLK